MEQFETVIDTEKSMFSVKELIKYKDLIVMFVKRNFTIMYKQTILGPAWILINPLVTSVIFTFIFGNIANISTDGIPSLLFYMAGNSLWSFFATSFTGTSNTFVANAGILGKVYFPRLVMPISSIITSFVNFLVQMCLFAVMYVFYGFNGFGVQISYYIVLLPVVLLQAGMLGLGCGVIVSSLTTKYRDLAIAVGFGVQVWMYATPIAYPLSVISGKYKMLMLINPMTQPVEILRQALLGTGEVNIVAWLASIVVTVIFLFVGVKLFSKVERTFMDTV